MSNNTGVNIPEGGSGAASVALLTAILATLTGAERDPVVIESLADGTTPAGVQNFSIGFDGPGGSLDGVDVPNGYIANFSPQKGDDTVDGIPYTVPTGGNMKVIIAYVEV